MSPVRMGTENRELRTDIVDGPAPIGATDNSRWEERRSRTHPPVRDHANQHGRPGRGAGVVEGFPSPYRGGNLPDVCPSRGDQWYWTLIYGELYRLTAGKLPADRPAG